MIGQHPNALLHQGSCTLLHVTLLSQLKLCLSSAFDIFSDYDFNKTIVIVSFYSFVPKPRFIFLPFSFKNMSFPPERCNSFQIAHPPPTRKLFAPANTTEPNHMNAENDDTFQVFLRIKPNSESKHSSDCIRIEDSVKLVCKPPSSSKLKKLEKVEYTFSNIFGPKTSQTEIFSNCVINRVEDLLNSRNSLIFTYGTTNAGKTFTVQGNAKNPGIIPQSLHTLFSNIEIHPDPRYMPCMAKDLEKMLVETSEEKIRVTNEILRSFQASCKSTYVESSHFIQSSQNTSVNLKNNKPSCSVWISFVEIYNETVYDLLDPKIMSRKALKIAADPDDNFYVKELKQIYVSSAEEAFTIYQYGKKNLNIAATKMNENSSRSHCIFTIHVINLDDECNPRMSKLCICDLAGSERQTKTQNVGLRLKESGNINSSLFKLNCCLRAIRENQIRGTKHKIPYRYSNLTKLLHSALDDRTDEKIIMIVNVNPSAELFDETQQVLKMCAIASKIKNKPLTSTFQRSTRFASLICGRENAPENGCHTPLIRHLSESFRNSDDEVQELLELLVQRDSEIKQLKTRIDLEEESHKNSKKILTEHCDKVEITFRNRVSSLEERLKSQKEYYVWKVAETKKSTFLDNIDEAIRRELDEKNSRIKELEDQLSGRLYENKVKKSSVEDLNNSVIKEQKDLEKDIKIEELEKKIVELEHELQNGNFSFSEKMNEKDMRIKELESIIEEAKEEYLFLEKKLSAESLKITELHYELFDKNEMIQQLECHVEELEQKNESIEEMLSKNAIEHEFILREIETDRDNRLAEREAKIAELKGKLREVKHELVAIRVIVEDLNRKLQDDSRNGEIFALKTQVKELSGRLRAQTTERESEVASLNKKICRLMEEQKELRTDKDRQLAASISEIENLTMKLYDKNEQLGNLKRMIEKLKKGRRDKYSELAAPIESEIESEKDDRRARGVKLYIDGKCDKIDSTRKNRKGKLGKHQTLHEKARTDVIVCLKPLQISEIDSPERKARTSEMETKENGIARRYKTRGSALKTPSGKENSSIVETPMSRRLKRDREEGKTLAFPSLLDDSSDTNVFRNTYEKGKPPNHRQRPSRVMKKIFTSSPCHDVSSPQLYSMYSAKKNKLFSASPSPDCRTHHCETSSFRKMNTPLKSVKIMKTKK